MDGLIQNLIQTALQGRLDRIMANESLVPWTFGIILSGFVALLVFALIIVLYLTWWERKFLGFIQIRLGPNRVGPWGLLQPFADMIKLLIKEDIVPKDADRILHLLGPLIIFIPTMLAFVVIPFGKGTVELKQNLVAPTFEHRWMTWIPAENASEFGLDCAGWLEPEIGIEVNEEAHKTWWVPTELDHEPLYLPTDNEGNFLPDAVDDNGVPLDVRYRFGGYAVLQNKPDNPSDPPTSQGFWDMTDYRTLGRQYQVLEIRWDKSSRHNGIVELGLDGRQIDSVEEEFSEVISGIGPDVALENRYDFGQNAPKATFDRLFGTFADSIAINNRKFGPASMVPAFGEIGDSRASSRDIYSSDWKHSAFIHGGVSAAERKAGLYFFPNRSDAESELDLTGVDGDDFDWTESGASFRLQRSGDGYVIETASGETMRLDKVGDSANVMIGDEPMTLTLKDSQYYNIYIVGKDLGVGILYLLAVTSLAVLGIFAGGFGSNNKWSLYGALRSGAQMMSYEIPMTLAVMGPVVMAGSLSMIDLVEQGQRTVWYVVPQFLAFFVFLVCMTAEVNRSPFDIPEAESELVAGFHTEYSGLKFGFFFLAEYANMFVASGVMTVLFFGGWRGPVIPFLGEFLSSFIWFMGKVFFWLSVLIWFRGTFPRFRVDQMMDYAWKVLLPLAMINIVMTSWATYSDWNFTIWKFANWTLWNRHILPIFKSDFSSFYTLPLVVLLSILFATDMWGVYKDTRRTGEQSESAGRGGAG